MPEHSSKLVLLFLGTIYRWGIQSAVPYLWGEDQNSNPMLCHRATTNGFLLIDTIEFTLPVTFTYAHLVLEKNVEIFSYKFLGAESIAGLFYNYL